MLEVGLQVGGASGRAGAHTWGARAPCGMGGTGGTGRACGAVHTQAACGGKVGLFFHERFPMRGDAPLMTSAPSGLLGVLRSWFGAGTSEAWSDAAEPARPTLMPPPHSYGAVSVLVADDNPVNLMVIAALLEARGLYPMLAADGAEAVALASQMSFDLILMDLQMPVLDGLGATVAIRHFERTTGRPHAPVVAYSSALPSAAVLAAHGFVGSLFKPCEDQDLEDCLLRWCPTYHAAPPLEAFAWVRTEQGVAALGRPASGACR